RPARDRARAGAAARSYDVVLADEITTREPVERERGEVEGGVAIHDELGDGLTSRGRVHEAVPAEPGTAHVPGKGRDASDDRMFVRRVLVEARPAGLHSGLLEWWHAVERALHDRRQEVPVDRVVEAGGVRRIGHAHEHAAGLAMEIEGRRHLDG